jgi:hypothetical protein
MALPGAYASASIPLLVTGARKPPLHDKEVDLEEEPIFLILLYRNVSNNFDFLFYSLMKKSAFLRHLSFLQTLPSHGARGHCTSITRTDYTYSICKYR